MVKVRQVLGPRDREEKGKNELKWGTEKNEN